MAVDSSAEALSVSNTPELIELLKAELAVRDAEDSARYESVLAQLAAWREERALETAVLLDALKQLASISSSSSSSSS